MNLYKQKNEILGKKIKINIGLMVMIFGIVSCSSVRDNVNIPTETTNSSNDRDDIKTPTETTNTSNDRDDIKTPTETTTSSNDRDDIKTLTETPNPSNIETFTFSSSGKTLKGKIFLPDSYETNKNLPAIFL
ncbi:MAG: hypothetical protein N2D54_06710, partial [Chloroflexota bacterium]